MIAIRSFQPEDALGVSALFRLVYGERYVYPDIYLPGMIGWHNARGHWRSAVAEQNGKIIGHATLWRQHSTDQHAELAMFVTHPSIRHRGIATALGEHLCARAQEMQLTTLTIKMVCSHPHSQQLAKTLGFHSTALLRDYVASPFAAGKRESVIFGVRALRPRPVPLSSAPHNGWLSLLADRFGSAPLPSAIPSARPLETASNGERVDIIIHHLQATVCDEVARFPANRLIYLRAPADDGLRAHLPVLHRAGFRDMGLKPASDGRWWWLLQRGFSRQELPLRCPVARALQANALAITA